MMQWFAQIIIILITRTTIELAARFSPIHWSTLKHSLHTILKYIPTTLSLFIYIYICIDIYTRYTKSQGLKTPMEVPHHLKQRHQKDKSWLPSLGWELFQLMVSADLGITKPTQSMGRLYIYLHEWLIFYSRLVGKSTIPMDPSWEMKRAGLWRSRAFTYVDWLNCQHRPQVAGLSARNHGSVDIIICIILIHTYIPKNHDFGFDMRGWIATNIYIALFY